jgi:hypothetical protein
MTGSFNSAFLTPRQSRVTGSEFQYWDFVKSPLPLAAIGAGDLALKLLYFLFAGKLASMSVLSAYPFSISSLVEKPSDNPSS